MVKNTLYKEEGKSKLFKSMNNKVWGLQLILSVFTVKVKLDKLNELV